MGITNGAEIVSKFAERGHYNRYARTYKIYVDGELISYKGYNSVSTVQANAEDAIAGGSIEYLSRLVDKINRYLPGKLIGVNIFMDGCIRVGNKRVKRTCMNADIHLVRRYFKEACKKHEYNLIELDEGEAELEMYLQRDKTSDLNIFVTEDSDMLSICYGHMPDFLKDRNDVCIEVPLNFDNPNVIDHNCVYAMSSDVRDSCVWVKQREGVLIMIAFDEKMLMIGYNVTSFRVFAALCGTDFTESFLTKSMAKALLRVSVEEKKKVNELTDIREIAATLMYLGTRYYGHWKINVAKASLFDSNLSHFSYSVYRYIIYVSTGKMFETKHLDLNVPAIVYELLQRTYDEGLTFNPQMYRRWCTMHDIPHILKNFRESFGSDKFRSTLTTKVVAELESNAETNSLVDRMKPLESKKRPLAHIERARLLKSLVIDQNPPEFSQCTTGYTQIFNEFTSKLEQIDESTQPITDDAEEEIVSVFDPKELTMNRSPSPSLISNFDGPKRSKWCISDDM